MLIYLIIIILFNFIILILEQQPMTQKRTQIKIIGSLILILMLSSISLGCLLNNNDEDDKPEGFSPDTLLGTVPLAYNSSKPYLDPKPAVNTTIPKHVHNIIAIWFFEKNAVYRQYGGTINLLIKNNGTQMIYVYQIGVKLQYYKKNRLQPDSKVFAEAGKFIAPGDEVDVGMVQFHGPLDTGDYQYSILFSLFLQNDSGFWNDCGEQESTEKDLTVVEPPNTVTYEQHYNLIQYYKKINEIVAPSSPEVYNLSHQLANQFQAQFNIYQACAVFDYVRNEIKYFSDPATTTNYWCTPEQTLKFGGDCEDHSTLIASLLISLGGSVRMYMTDSHAFIALYIGNSSHLDGIIKGIHNYYGTNLNLFYFSDKLGNWLMVDTIGSIYLGGLPLGAVPVITSNSDSNLSWGFTETKNLFITDVIPE